MSLPESFKAVVSSTLTGVESPEEVLSQLEKMGIDWHVTEEGTLMIKYWQVGAENFVSPEHAASIRLKGESCEPGAELDWVSKNLDRLRQQYGGQWIAVYNCDVVASATDLPQLMLEIKEYDKPFTTFIPAEPIIWTFTYAH